MRKKVSLLLVFCLVAVGFIVIPAAASVCIWEGPNGDAYVYTDSDASLRIFHFDNGTWTRTYYDKPSSSNQLTIYSPSSSTSNKNSYPTSLISQTKPLNIRGSSPTNQLNRFSQYIP
jgi:hypothetical protein